MSLSSGLSLADLSDYLAPSQLCIKPVTLVEDDEQPFTQGENNLLTKDISAAATEIVIDGSGHYESSANGLKGKKLKKAEITLNDCLACSGCITSAESVLVSMQSHEEVYRVLAEQPELLPIVSISPQTLASLAALYDLPMRSTLLGLRRFFKATLGFALVFDTTFARTLSLAESRAEFLERRAYRDEHSTPPTPAELGSSPLDASSSSTGPLPVLSSSCPGWICYAEKTHGELLPFVSNVKSPQAIMGTLVKSPLGGIAASLGKKPQEVYHVSVMPCYDKKLEASRPDFATEYEGGEKEGVRDVDCVLTTGEVAKMLADKGLSLRELARGSVDPSEGPEVEGAEEERFLPSLLYAQGTSSGGALHNTIRAVVSSLSAEALYAVELESKQVRSEDYIEYKLLQRSPEDGSKHTLLQSAKCYGFRNLQNVVRKLAKDAGVAVTRGAAGKMPASSAAAAANAKRAAAKAAASGKPIERGLEFVEVMACPGGCVNGGGQIAPPKSSLGERRKEWEGARDEEGMPEAGEQMEVDSLEVKLVMDQEEHGHGRVLSAKEWVAHVERTYWAGQDPSATAPSPGLPAHLDGLDWSRVHESVRPYVAQEVDEIVGRLQEKVMKGLVGAEGDESGERRRMLLRTSYRRVESEEVNGLAVVW